jgi:hypothetical protein
MSTFPSELTDIVIDYLHSDREALTACALVCKVWLPASRYHLFYTIHVDEQNVTQFFEILDTPRCISWRPYIRHLDITGIRRYTVSLLDEAALSTLSTIYTIEALSLRNFNGYDGASFARLSSTFPRVKELKISHGFFHSFSHCMRIATSFPLEHLTLELNHYFNQEPFPVDVTNLRIIHLGSLIHREVSILGKFLRDVGPSLTHLYLARPQFLSWPCSDSEH